MERQRRVYSIKGISPTVLARADSTKIYVNVKGENKIRKITPVENFYIQGFSRGFPDWGIPGTGSKGIFFFFPLESFLCSFLRKGT